LVLKLTAMVTLNGIDSVTSEPALGRPVTTDTVGLVCVDKSVRYTSVSDSSEEALGLKLVFHQVINAPPRVVISAVVIPALAWKYNTFSHFWVDHKYRSSAWTVFSAGTYVIAFPYLPWPPTTSFT